MKKTEQPPSDRRQKVIDSMAKKFADHGSVEQIITKHRRKLLRSSKAIYTIVGITVASMIITGLITAGIVKSPLAERDRNLAAQQVKNTLDLLRADLNISIISPDQFVLYCKDYLIQYDSLPEKYKTSFSTTSSAEVYSAICDIWSMLSARTRQTMLRELPRIAEENERRSLEPPK